jgi:hypothetical protein
MNTIRIINEATNTVEDVPVHLVTTREELAAWLESATSAPSLPNPVYSLCETVHDLSLNLHNDWVAGRLNVQDSRERAQLAIEWAQEFEAMHQGREWDGEYLEEVDLFYATKAKEYLKG